MAFSVREDGFLRVPFRVSSFDVCRRPSPGGRYKLKPLSIFFSCLLVLD
jgi:hypothetical protein